MGFGRRVVVRRDNELTVVEAYRRLLFCPRVTSHEALSQYHQRLYSSVYYMKAHLLPGCIFETKRRHNKKTSPPNNIQAERVSFVAFSNSILFSNQS
jgi:hypothetical protein